MNGKTKSRWAPDFTDSEIGRGWDSNWIGLLAKARIESDNTSRILWTIRTANDASVDFPPTCYRFSSARNYFQIGVVEIFELGGAGTIFRTQLPCFDSVFRRRWENQKRTGFDIEIACDVTVIQRT